MVRGIEAVSFCEPARGDGTRPHVGFRLEVREYPGRNQDGRDDEPDGDDGESGGDR